MNTVLVIAVVAMMVDVAVVGLLVREPWKRLASRSRELGELRGLHQVSEAQVQQLSRELSRARTASAETARELYAIQEDLADAITNGSLERAGVDVRAVLGRMLQAEAAASSAAAAAAAGLDDAVPPGRRDARDAAGAAATADDVPIDDRELLGRTTGDARGELDASGAPATAGNTGRVPTAGGE